MSDLAHKKTDLKLEEIEKHLSAIYSTAQKDIQKKADEYFDKFKKTDEEKRKLVKQGKLTDEEYRKWRQGKIMYGKRFTSMKEDVAKQLLNVNQTATAYINGELPEIYTLNYNALAETVDGVGGYSFTLVDRDTVKHLATTDTNLLPFRELDPTKDIPWNMKAINSEVLQGIIQGESIPDMSKRIFGEIMKTAKTEGLTDKEMGALLKRNRDASIRSARTIVTGAENKGRLDSFKRAEADGIILQKEWLSSDQPGRTRDWHLPHSFESLVVDIDKPFVNGMGKIMFPGDPSADGANVYNCRCSMASVVKGFKKAQVEKAMEEAETINAEEQIKKYETEIQKLEEEYKKETLNALFGYTEEGAKKAQTIKTNLDDLKNKVEKLKQKTNSEQKNNVFAKITSPKQAHKKLDEIGFKGVGKGISNLDGDMLVDNVNQLTALEEKFGALKKSNVYIKTSQSSNAIASVSSTEIDTSIQTLKLSKKHYGKPKNHYVDMQKARIDSGWSMAVSEDMYSVYTVTHEYGHIVQNNLIGEAYKKLPVETKSLFNHDSLKALEWRKDEAVKIQHEIIDIAKEISGDERFMSVDYISDYGKKDSYEFFAECFASSQLGKPNILGQAMNIWLDKKGLVIK